jgi:hypothetical protein
MFLSKLYRQHKGWFVFVVLFIIGQLFINYKHGIVFSPFYHYGMYSAVMMPSEKYEVTEIDVNGKPLQTKDFTPQAWDKIMLPLSMNNTQQQWNSSLYNELVKSFLHTKDSSAYVNSYTSAEFKDWYETYLTSILHTKIDPLNIKTITANKQQP